MWMGKLVEVNATPVLMLGIGNGGKVGKVHVCTLDNVSDEMMIHLLRSALKELECGI